jgi:hypothetical protein
MWWYSIESKTSTPAKPQKPARPPEYIGKVAKDSPGSEPAKVKSRNLDVVAEHSKAKKKKAANFVVIGEFGKLCPC